MNFWKSFSKKAVLRQFFFVLALFAILIPIALWDSGTQVKVTFEDTYALVRSDRYRMQIFYQDIDTVELTALVAPGEKVADSFDDNIVRYGTWRNDTWGEYTVCADPDTSNCVVVRLDDGRVLVFSQKNDATTQEKYEELLGRLS